MEVAVNEKNKNIGFIYLKNRGIEENEINEFKIGYCDPDLLIYSYNFPDKCCDFVTDKFRNSIILPFYSLYDDYIGVLCRRIESVKRNKYDSTSFSKTNHLFGLNKAWKYMLERDFVYIVEGPFDMIVCWKYGYKNTIALLGTNLSFIQICLLKRFVKKAYFVLDNDKAGISATLEYSKQLRDFGIESYSFNLLNDPDVILKDNHDALKVI